MFGGSAKMGRGGGGGGGGRGAKRLIPPAPPRPAGNGGGRAGGSRLSMGRGSAGKPAAAAGTEETFGLVSSERLAYGLMIRLSPDLLEEIKRVEAEGGSARIKFDAFSQNSENVIDVGGKDFGFTWSSELGVCDIYKECQSEHDGSGLLVESGTVWRKLNINRVLDESIKNHVKMRSEEAERQHRSRKSIVLDPANPSVKSSARTMAAAAVEGNMRRFHFKHKNEVAFKKNKNETSQGPPKSTFKSGISTNIQKGRPSLSPQQSSPLKFGLAPSTSPAGSNFKKLKAVEDVAFNFEISGKEENAGSERELLGKASESDTLRPDNGLQILPGDLHSALIHLLMENPKGMNLKALEKAVIDTHPNSGKKIEGIVKKIGTFQASGRYILKPGVTLDSIKKPSSESGSSPESVRLQTPVPDAEFEKKANVDECELQTQLDLAFDDETNNLGGGTDSHHNSPDTDDRKFTSNNDEKADSSSESGSDSDSDSDSSDSGSDSGSQSKSRSPAGSRSGTSSDSESDGTSSGKEGSDVDVDILTRDDEKEVEKKSLDAVSRTDWETNAVELGQKIPNESRSDHLVSSSDFGSRPIEECEGDDDVVDSDIDITKESPASNHVNSHNQKNELEDISNILRHKKNSRSLDRESLSSPACDKQEENGNRFGSYRNDIGRKISQPDKYSLMNLDHGQSHDAKGAGKMKHKRPSDPNYLHAKLENNKRLKAETLKQEPIRTGNENNFSEPQRWPNQVVTTISVPPENLHHGHENSKFHNSTFTDQLHSNERIVEPKAQQKISDSIERHGRHSDGLSRGTANFDRDYDFPLEIDESSLRSGHAGEKQPNKGSAYESSHSWDIGVKKNSKDSAAGEAQFDSLYMSSDDKNGKSHGSIQAVKGSMLTRELSDLELGEFREPMLGVVERQKRKFDRKSSFSVDDGRDSLRSEEIQVQESGIRNLTKSLDNRLNVSDNLSNMGKGKSLEKSVQPSRRMSPSKSKTVSNQEGSKRKNLEDESEDPKKGQHLANEHVDSDGGFQSDKLADSSKKVRKTDSDGTGRKTSVSLESNFGRQTVKSDVSKQKKADKVHKIASNDKRKGYANSCTNERKRRDSSSDEDYSVYLKYEKNEPNLKGHIKDHLQYKEYVKEYLEMYDHYCSLRRKLEEYRNYFLELGRELDLARGKDAERYSYILEQLKESYHRDGTKHKKLKKIFIVLHEELKHIKRRIIDYAETYSKD